jgi:hypothetical protein
MKISFEVRACANKRHIVMAMRSDGHLWAWHYQCSRSVATRLARNAARMAARGETSKPGMWLRAEEALRERTVLVMTTSALIPEQLKMEEAA